MTTTRTDACVGLAGCGVELGAAHAQKGGFPAGVFEERVVATIVEDPQPEKKSRDEQAVDDRGGGEIHAAVKTDWLSAQTSQ